MKGHLFENLVINEFMKEFYNRGEEPAITFWRDKTGNEVDLLLQDADYQTAYEIKSGETFSVDYFRGISYWSKLSGATAENCFLIYNGSSKLKTSMGEVQPWITFQLK